jgi:hypothetical protein
VHHHDCRHGPCVGKETRGQGLPLTKALTQASSLAQGGLKECQRLLTTRRGWREECAFLVQRARKMPALDFAGMQRLSVVRSLRWMRAHCCVAETSRLK